MLYFKFLRPSPFVERPAAASTCIISDSGVVGPLDFVVSPHSRLDSLSLSPLSLSLPSLSLSLSLSLLCWTNILSYTYPSLKYFHRSLSPLLINCGRIFSTLPTKRVVPTIHRPRVKIHQRRINIVEVCGCQRQLLCELYIFLEINSKCFLYKWGGEYFFNWIRNNTFKLQRMNLKRSWQQGQSTLYSTP